MKETKKESPPTLLLIAGGAAALLLSGGDKQTKATLLFDIVDEDYSKWATFAQLRTLFSALAKVSILVGEVCANQDPLPDSRNKTLRMLDTAVVQRKTTIEKLLKLFELLKSQRVPQPRFVSLMTEIDNGMLLTTSGWRAALVEGGANYSVYMVPVLSSPPPQLPLPVL